MMMMRLGLHAGPNKVNEATLPLCFVSRHSFRSGCFEHNYIDEDFLEEVKIRGNTMDILTY